MSVSVSSNRRRQRVALVFIPLVIWLATSVLIARFRTVHVLNGASKPIAVLIDDERLIELAQFDRTSITLAEGTHTFRITSPKSLEQSGDFDFATGFFERFFHTPVFLLDPGRTAIVLCETATIGKTVSDVSVTHEFHPCEIFTAFPHADFILQEFPSTIEAVDLNSRRTRVDVFLSAPHLAVGYVAEELTDEQQLEFCERHLLIEPTYDDMIDTYCRLSFRHERDERLFEFLHRGLDRRPVEIEWHRRFQDVSHRLERFDLIDTTYHDLVEHYPHDSALLYLRGRIETDRHVAKDHFDRSIAADPSNAFPWFARCHDLSSIGEYEGAKAACERALQLSPKNRAAKRRLYNIRLALGEYGELISERRSTLRENPVDGIAHQQLLSALAARGDLKRVREAHETYAKAVRSLHPKKAHQRVLTSARMKAYFERDLEAVLALSREIESEFGPGQLVLEALFELQRIDHLDRSSLMDRSASRAYLELHLCLTELQRGNRQKASEWFHLAIEDLRNGDRESKLVAKTLTQESESELARGLNSLSMQTGERLVMSTTAAMICTGDARRELVELATRINSSPQFPHHFIKDSLSWLSRQSDEPVLIIADSENEL